MLSTRNPLQTHINWKWEGGKNICHETEKQMKDVVAILIYNKIDLKLKKVKRDKKGHYMMIKRWIQEEDITTVNIYSTSIGVPQYIRKTITDIKGEIYDNTIILDLNAPLTPKNRSKQKIDKETQFLNDTWDEMDLIDNFRTFYPNTEEYICFSSAHGTLSRIDHILGTK